MRASIRTFFDFLIYCVAIAAVLVANFGGFTLDWGWFHLAVHSLARIIGWLLALIAIRWLIDRSLPSRAPLARVWHRVYAADADGTPPSPQPIGWRQRLIAGAVIAGFGAILLHQQLAHFDYVTDLGDPLFSIWRLNWVSHQLAGDPRPLFDANIYYPAKRTLTFSDSMLLPGTLNGALRAIGLHPVIAYNLLLVGTFFASAAACYVLVEHLTRSSAAAVVAALLFAFAPYHFEHYSHLELLMAFWIPLSLLALHRFLETGALRYAIATGLTATALLYSSMYLAVLYMWVAAAIAVTLWLAWRPPLRKMIVGGVLAALIGITSAIPLARAYASAGLPDRSLEELATYSATPTDYFRGNSRSALWQERPLGHAQPERGLFPGALILVLAAMALRPPLGTVRTAYAVALFIAFHLTMGYHSGLYRMMYEWLPFMRGMRAPARASIILDLALAVLAGFTVRAWVARRRPLPAAALLAVLIAVAAVDLYPKLQLERVWREPPAIYEALRGRSEVVLAEFPLGLSPEARIVDTPHMYFSLWHWHQIVNGYSGHAPSRYLDFQQALQPFPEKQTLQVLRDRGVTHVTVNCALYQPGCEKLLRRVAAVPELRLLSSTTWEGQPVQLYELLPAG